MKKNNKLTRKLKQQKFVKTQDGTEVLRSSESRAKVRRWSFEADIEIVLPAQPASDDTPGIPEQVLPKRSMKLSGVHYGTAKEARQAALENQHHLREVNDMFKRSRLNVRAIPHETVSNETMRQMLGYRDMAGLLDRALELCIGAAQDILAQKSVGIRFVESLAEEGKPARTLITIKEDFYAQAVKEKTVELQSATKLSETGSEGVNVSDSVPVSSPNVSSDGTPEEKRVFVPEIVEIQRVAGTPDTEEVIGLGTITEEQAAQAVADMSV